MLGLNHVRVSYKRKDDAQASVIVVCQSVCRNSKTDRQVNLKSQSVFKQTVQTPVSIGAPMCVHTRFRDYHLVHNLSEKYIGVEYKKHLDLVKRVEYAVIDRINNTGYMCIPEFVRKGVHCWFAVDNIDFLEFTAYGGGTLHGAIIVMFQRDEDGEIINPPLKIPMKLPKENLKMILQYKAEPEIIQHPIRFATFCHDFTSQDQVEKYFTFTETWALSSLAGNETFDVVPERLQNVVPSTADTPNADIEADDQNIEEADTHEAIIPDQPDPQQVIDDRTDDENYEEDNEPGDRVHTETNEDENEPGDEVPTETPTAEPTLKVIKNKDKLTKNSVMPT